MNDELNYIKILESAGLNRQQAEAHINVIRGAMTDDLAKKSDLEEMRIEMNQRFNAIDARFTQVDERFNRIDERFNRIDERFNKLEEMINRQFWKLAGVICVTMGLIEVLLPTLKKLSSFFQ